MSKTAKISSLVAFAAASLALTFVFAGCNKNGATSTDQTQPAATDQSSSSQPAATGQSQSAGASAQPAAPETPQEAEASGNLVQASAGSPQDQNYASDDYDADSQDSTYGQPALQASQAPPPLPEYSQPDCPDNGYLWTPGYWSYASAGYYWVPGVWAQPPQVGFLWTPGYWGFGGGSYRYHYGYWGAHIGFYGGINYGFGYVGVGYQGGYWNGNQFYYNRAVNNVTLTNVRIYNRTVTNTVINNVTINNTTINRASYNGPGGVTRKPLPAEIAATREQRIPPMTTQIAVRDQAAKNKQQFFAANHEHPAVFASPKPIAAGKPIAKVIPARAVAPAKPLRKMLCARSPNRPRLLPSRRAVNPRKQPSPGQNQKPSRNPSLLPGPKQNRPPSPKPSRLLSLHRNPPPSPKLGRKQNRPPSLRRNRKRNPPPSPHRNPPPSLSQNRKRKPRLQPRNLRHALPKRRKSLATSILSKTSRPSAQLCRIPNCLGDEDPVSASL